MNEDNKSEFAITNQVIFTSAEEFAGIAFGELRRADQSVKLIAWLAPGTGLVELRTDFITVSSAFRKKPPIFIRHICPVYKLVELNNSMEDITKMSAAAHSLITQMDAEKSISVQIRLAEKVVRPYSQFEINESLSATCQELGYTLDISSPEQIISVVCTSTVAYMGVSLVEDNLSNWTGGARRFSREEHQISRAEFKLLEAIDLFGLQLPTDGDALDLGAAPGGWTRILRQYHLNVTAIDPAKLDAAIAADPAVTHIQQTAQQFLQNIKDGQKFDLIVNDMKIDARETSRIMASAAQCIRTNGMAIVTLKLPGREAAKVVDQSLTLLSKVYEVIGARQLFHNRSEITVALKIRK